MQTSPHTKSPSHRESGFVMVSTLLFLTLILGLLLLYHSTSAVEIATVRYSKGNSSGFYSAEAGLNLRADTIRSIFVGFNRPTGASPSEAIATKPCATGNMGTGDFACANYTFNKRSVKTYVIEDASNPVILTIPPGEKYQNLNAQEYRYTAKSIATDSVALTEADLELRFKSRLVPLFQFAAFYNKDLEILPGPIMSLSGPVHTNGDLYLYSSSATLTVNGQVTTAGNLYRGRKDDKTCNNNAVYIFDPLASRSLIPSCATLYQVKSSDITAWNNQIQMKVPIVTVPTPDVFDPTPGKIYWDKADLRVVLELSAANSVVGIQVRTAANAVDAAASATLNACAGTISGKAVGTTQIYNFREAKNIRLLDIDMKGVLNCLKSSNWFNTGKLLSDATEGGLVFHLTVKSPTSSNPVPNPYGVRIKNGATLQSSIAGAPLVKGLTVVSDQALYIQGDYNSVNKIPAATLSDSLNLLSNSWVDANSALAIGSRVVGGNMTVNAAFLAGTDTTRNIEGVGGQGGGAYNGGLENYPRFHENWAGRTLIYRGSFVSLGKPQHVSGAWATQSYGAPNRDWNYDTSFNNAANLPPITPRFVYLKQELFIRDFTQ